VVLGRPPPMSETCTGRCQGESSSSFILLQWIPTVLRAEYMGLLTSMRSNSTSKSRGIVKGVAGIYHWRKKKERSVIGFVEIKRKKCKTTHLGSKLLNPTRIDRIGHIRIRVLETDGILLGPPAG
jgi:hypothetical protein